MSKRAILPYVLADDDIPRPIEAGPLQTTFVELLGLAASIRRDKLTNPITLVRYNDGYLIETGERRWLAYHLLHWVFPEDDQWTRVPAHTVEQFDVWRQATENTMRQNLNAIGHARQLAILLMDLYRQMDATFQSYDELVAPDGCDRLYYAQVADGNEFRIPRGKGEMLLNATGLKNEVQLRQYRNLLRLPDDLWIKADDLNLTEGEIRKLKPSIDIPRLGLEYIDESVARLGPFEPPRPELSYLRNLDSKPPKNREELQQSLMAVREWLDTLEHKLAETEPQK